MKYIKVIGLNPDYTDVVYELNARAISDLVQEAYQHGKDGGDFSDIKVEIVEMTPDEARKIEEV